MRAMLRKSAGTGRRAAIRPHSAPKAPIFLVLVSALSAACWERDAQDGESFESPREFAALDYHADFVWDFQQVVTIDLALDASLLPDGGAATVEVRHTLDGGSLIFRGRLDQTSGLSRQITTRVPQTESALSVTVRTRNGLVRHTVPITDARAVTHFP